MVKGVYVYIAFMLKMGLKWVNYYFIFLAQLLRDAGVSFAFPFFFERSSDRI